MFVRRKGDEFLGGDALLFGKYQCFAVGEQETVSKVRTHRVADVAFSSYGAERLVLYLRCVLCWLAHREYTPDTDDYAPRLVRQRRAFGVEEAKRLAWSKRVEKGIEQRELVLPLLDPGPGNPLTFSISDVRLTLGYPADLETFRQPNFSRVWIPLNLFA